MAEQTTKTSGWTQMTSNPNDLEALNRWENALQSPYEHMWVLLGYVEGDLWHGRMVPMSVGGPALVAFDANWVLKREEEYGDVVGFLHTHPSFTSHYSSRDDRTMKAWCLCFGKPLACCIKGTDGLTAWWYMDDETPPEYYQVRRVKKLLFGVTPALYEYGMTMEDPAAGLDKEDDPNFRPIEEFLPEDEKAEWHALQKQFAEEAEARRLSEGSNGQQQVPS